ncbi:MAG: hypothetical protein Q4F45_03980, partial [Alistipes sp.]|nr:hypothetical protein [Alistipes sp.]
MENTTTEYPSQTLMFDSVCISPDKQIALHFQNNWELSCIITGEGTRLIANTYEPFSAGEVVLIPPEVPHCWYFNKEKTDKNNNIENITITFNTDFLTNI